MRENIRLWGIEMRSLHKKHITIVFILFLTLMLILGFQNCGKNMQTLKDYEVLGSGGPIGGGGPSALDPIGIFLVGIGSQASSYDLNRFYWHNTDGAQLNTHSIGGTFFIHNYMALDDIGSANNGPADRIQDVATLERKLNTTTNEHESRIVIYSGADFQPIRSLVLPKVPGSMVYQFYLYSVGDRDSDQKRDLLLMALRSTFGSATVAPVSSNRARFKVISSQTLNDVQAEFELPVDLTNTSIGFSYSQEANVTGDSQKEYMFRYFSYDYTTSTYTLKYYSYSLNGAFAENDLSSLSNYFPNYLQDITQDGVAEIIYITEAVSVIGTRLRIYNYQTKALISELEVEDVVGVYSGERVKPIRYSNVNQFDYFFLKSYQLTPSVEEIDAVIVDINGSVLVESVKDQIISQASDIVDNLKVTADYDNDGTEDILAVINDGSCFGQPTKEILIVSGKTFERLHEVSLKNSENNCDYYFGYPTTLLLLENGVVRDLYLGGSTP